MIKRLMTVLLTLGLLVGGSSVATAAGGGYDTSLKKSASTASVKIVGHSTTGANKTRTLSPNGLLNASGFRDVTAIEILPGTVVQRYCYLGSGVRTSKVWGYAGVRTYKAACNDDIPMVLIARSA